MVGRYVDEAISYCNGRYNPVDVPTIKDGKHVQQPKGDDQCDATGTRRNGNGDHCGRSFSGGLSSSSNSGSCSSSTTGDGDGDGCGTPVVAPPTPLEMVQLAMATPTEWQLTAEMKGLDIDAAVYKVQ